MQTPYYLLDERRLQRNLEVAQRIRATAGVKVVLALKCFASWSVFGLFRQYLDGTTSSGVYEARLGRENFGGEVHAFSVAFTPAEMGQVRQWADKIIFNSLSQLETLAPLTRGRNVGVRINPGFSYSRFDLANPARPHCRLGLRSLRELRRAAPLIRGAMFHFNCENTSFPIFAEHLERLSQTYGWLLDRLEWVSLGGGLAFTRPGYPVARFSAALRAFGERHGVHVYLEPGEAIVTGAGELVTTVLDVVSRGGPIAIVDASVEAHLLDHLIYRTSPRVAAPAAGRSPVTIAGRSCLAGDVFGRYRLARRLRPGDQVRFADAAGYSIVKKNWFNGLPLPAIVVRRVSGALETVRTFGYTEYRSSLS